MVNPGICQQCMRCTEFKGVERDENEALVSTPWADCSVAGYIVSPSSEVPKGCPYRVEHVLTAETTSNLVNGWNKEFGEIK